MLAESFGESVFIKYIYERKKNFAQNNERKRKNEREKYVSLFLFSLLLVGFFSCTRSWKLIKWHDGLE
jgi:hypothetical protein